MGRLMAFELVSAAVAAVTFLGDRFSWSWLRFGEPESGGHVSWCGCCNDMDDQ